MLASRCSPAGDDRRQASIDSGRQRLTPIEAQAVAQAALFATFRLQVEHGHLTRAGLLALHARLAEYSNEFIPGVGLEAMRLAVDDALDVDQTDAIDDDPRGLLPPDQRD
jgi:hypothetical protein